MDHYYIYCLHNDDLPEYYVGHTVDLYFRWHTHKHDGNGRRKHRKVYKYIRNHGGFDNFKIEVLDEIYSDVYEARKLERYYTELLGATLNTNVAGRTEKEWKEKYFTTYKCICGLTLTCSNRARHFKTEKHVNFIRENIGF